MKIKQKFKFTWLILIFVLIAALFSGCGQGAVDGSDERFPIEENDCDSGELEANTIEEKTIGEIEESIDITEIAIQKAITEQQVMVSQEEFEQVLNKEVIPKPEVVEDEQPEPIVEVESFKNGIPEGLILDLKYDLHPSGHSYVLVTTNTL
ncbi:MAG: hypothetical protein JJE29_09435, partial [Peptostreptococcaceae bacterium]|nr:hypothetical protein [Peptostreptococcaceae bacterium]